MIEYIKAMVNGSRDRSEYITRAHAETLVARGRASWIPGLAKVKECSVKPMGHPKEWRKSRSAGYAVMQMVDLASGRPKHKPLACGN